MKSVAFSAAALSAAATALCVTTCQVSISRRKRAIWKPPELHGIHELIEERKLLGHELFQSYRETDFDYFQHAKL